VIVTGLYFIAIIAPAEAGVWDARIRDCEVLDREQAIAWINHHRPQTPAGTMYKLVELTRDELDEYDDDDLQ
jgi:hypothetical protein